MKPQNIYTAIPQSLEQEKFEQLVESQSVRIEKIISLGHRSPASGWYEQEKNEWVLLLKGKAILSFENQGLVHLKAGDFINIAARQKHKVDWTDPECESIWLAVHY